MPELTPDASAAARNREAIAAADKQRRDAERNVEAEAEASKTATLRQQRLERDAAWAKAAGASALLPRVVAGKPPAKPRQGIGSYAGVQVPAERPKQPAAPLRDTRPPKEREAPMAPKKGGRPPFAKPIDDAEVWRMHHEGMSNAAIAKTLHVAWVRVFEIVERGEQEAASKPHPFAYPIRDVQPDDALIEHDPIVTRREIPAEVDLAVARFEDVAPEVLEAEAAADPSPPETPMVDTIQREDEYLRPAAEFEGPMKTPLFTLADVVHHPEFDKAVADAVATGTGSVRMTEDGPVHVPAEEMTIVWTDPEPNDDGNLAHIWLSPKDRQDAQSMRNEQFRQGFEAIGDALAQGEVKLNPEAVMRTMAEITGVEPRPEGVLLTVGDIAIWQAELKQIEADVLALRTRRDVLYRRLEAAAVFAQGDY